MVGVLVRVHQEPDRLVGNELHDVLDHRQISALIERRLDNGYKVLELDRHAIVRCSAQQVHSFRELLRVHANRKGGPQDRVGNGRKVRARVGPDIFEDAAKSVVADTHVESAEIVIPSLMVMPDGRELDPAAQIDIALIRPFVFVIHVSENGIGNRSVDSLQHIFFVYGCVHPVLPEQGNGDNGHLPGHCSGAVAS